MQQDHLAVHAVTKSFRINGAAVPVLDGIDLSVASGQFLAVVGPSGCGKSTLLRLLAGLDTDYRGEIEHDGARVGAPSLDRGIVFQEPRLFPWLTVEQNIALGLLNVSIDAAARRRAVAEHIALVGLTGFEKAYPHQLSGGMAQRAAIARGLVNRPGLLLLDEPFGALDALTRQQLQNELQRIWSHEKTTMVLVTHDVDEAVYLGDRVIVLSSRPGRIAADIEVTVPRPRERSDVALADIRSLVMDALEAPRAIASITVPVGRPIAVPAPQPLREKVAV